MGKMKMYLKSNKKNLLLFAVMVFCAVGILIFVSKDYFLYKSTVANVSDVTQTLKRTEKSGLGFVDKTYDQRLTLEVKNGEHKGETVSAFNTYSISQVSTQKYEAGDKVFISLSGKSGELKAAVKDFKRDTYFAAAVLAFVIAIVMVGKLQGFMSVVSVVFNIFVLGVAMELYFKGLNLFVLCCVACVLFAVVSLLLVTGFTRKTAAAVISTLTVTALTTGLAELVLKLTDGSGVRFEQMEYLVRPYEVIFISELLVGGLGAVMDISVTMAASMSELIEKDKNISFAALMKSGKEIGRDVMGTMVNVLFFTYVCGCVPLIVLALRNNATFSDVMSNYISLEIVRSFVGSIGIVGAIPVAIAVCARLLKGGKHKGQIAIANANANAKGGNEQ